MSDWRTRAHCAGLGRGGDLFFPVGNAGPALLQIEQAKSACRQCPVARECLSYALETRQDAGVWGGLSEGERQSMLRRAARNKSKQTTS